GIDKVSRRCSRSGSPPIAASVTRTPRAMSARESSSAYCQTPPTVSHVINIRNGCSSKRGERAVRGIAASTPIDAIHDRGHVDHFLRSFVKARIALQLLRPVDQGATTPSIRRRSETFALRPLEAFDGKVVERSLDVAQRGAAARAVERCFDHGIATGGKVPRAGQTHACIVFARAVLKPPLHTGVVFDLVDRPRQC